ncbi:hypothetical protein FQN55_004250 [Onygenales sp. PD_40]|nr:hypothetical protein FQN55_004250 [Onygenales sp. PD_40]
MPFPSDQYAIPRGSLILVTGANGYIASHVIDILLELGYHVRGTVRTEKPWVDALFENKHGKGRYESVIVPVIEEAGAFEEAIKGVDGVVHVASDVSMRPDLSIITNAVNHTLGLLKTASKQTSVKRFVMTSSSGACLLPEPNKRGVIVDENTWNNDSIEGARDDSLPIPKKSVNVYCASKTEAERQAWEWVREQNPDFVFNTVVPNMNLGKILAPEISASTMGFARRLLKGDPIAMHVLPPQYYVNVIDNARLHVIGLLNPTVTSERIFAFAAPQNWTDLIAILRKLRPENKNIPDPPVDEGRDYSEIKPLKRAEGLLCEFFGVEGWIGYEESLAAGIEEVELGRGSGFKGVVDANKLVEELRESPEKRKSERLWTESVSGSMTPYSTRYASREEIPKFQIPKDGAPAEAVHRMLRDDLDLDGIPNLNMASFVGTYMEREANELVIANISKNLADADEYPALMEMHAHCVSMISNLWHAQHGEEAIGSATTGSSEAIHLGGLAMKRLWQQKRKAEGKDTSKPNIIMGANAQVALLKFARYFDVEARILDVSKKSQYRLDPELVRKNVDENTIGIFVILGSTYTGHYEPVEEVSKILDEFQAKTGIDIPIHVDAASGGFIAPFTYAGAGGPKWDFLLPRVKSINVSGHKYGLVYAGLGWIIWRDRSYLPKDLIFELHYLGGTEETFTLNFSRPGMQVIGQYYNLIRLGFNGFREIMENCLTNARLLSNALERTGWFVCVSSIHRKKGKFALEAAKGLLKRHREETSAEFNAGLPVVAFRFSDEFHKKYPDIKQESVSLLLRAKQYIIPNYPLPPTEDKIEILRIVVRESMSADLIDRLVADTVAIIEKLMATEAVDLAGLQTGPTSLARRRMRIDGGEKEVEGGEGEERPAKKAKKHHFKATRVC